MREILSLIREESCDYLRQHLSHSSGGCGPIQGVCGISGDAGSGGLTVQVDGEGAHCGVGAHLDGLVAGVEHCNGLGQQSAVDTG